MYLRLVKLNKTHGAHCFIFYLVICHVFVVSVRKWRGTIETEIEMHFLHYIQCVTDRIITLAQYFLLILASFRIAVFKKKEIKILIINNMLLLRS